MGKAALKKVAKQEAAAAPAADGLAGALSQIKEGKYQLRSTANAPSKARVTLPSAAAGDLATELKAKPIRLRAAGTKTKSGRFVTGPNSDRPGDTGVNVGMPGVKTLRKPKARPEPTKEMSELEQVRDRMAKKMQARLREMEEQDVADSWADESENKNEDRDGDVQV